MTQLQRVSAYILLIRERRILLCRLAPHISFAQEWTLPGGGIEFGEHPHDAAVREVLEETGYQVRIDGRPFVDSEHFQHKSNPAHALRLIYSGEILGGEMTHEINGSTDRCEWFTREEALALPMVGLARLGVDLAFAKRG